MSHLAKVWFVLRSDDDSCEPVGILNALPNEEWGLLAPVRVGCGGAQRSPVPSAQPRLSESYTLHHTSFVVPNTHHPRPNFALPPASELEAGFQPWVDGWETDRCKIV